MYYFQQLLSIEETSICSYILYNCKLVAEDKASKFHLLSIGMKKKSSRLTHKTVYCGFYTKIKFSKIRCTVYVKKLNHYTFII